MATVWAHLRYEPQRRRLTGGLPERSVNPVHYTAGDGVGVVASRCAVCQQVVQYGEWLAGPVLSQKRKFTVSCVQVRVSTYACKEPVDQPACQAEMVGAG